MPVPGHARRDPAERNVGPSPLPRLVQAAAPEASAWWGRPLAETRWALELARLLVDPVLRGDGIPHGSGRPVIIMPGFLAGDQTLAVMAAWLRGLGYRPHVCWFVANVDCSERAAERVERRVLAVHREYGCRVALVGHSRGGHYARAIAARTPERVSHAISLGSDLCAMLDVSVPTRVAVAAARRGLHATRRAHDAHCGSIECACAFTRDYYRAFPSDLVRLTSIYSKADGVVRWENSIVAEADCVEVTGSHVGLVCNRKAYRAIADALAQPELPESA
jgi:triacylglycerol lipase